MSDNETTSKKSILTTAMENVRAKKNNDSSDEKTLTPEEVAAKRSLRNARIFLAGSVAVFAATLVTIYRSAKDETDSEETLTED